MLLPLVYETSCRKVISNVVIIIIIVHVQVDTHEEPDCTGMWWLYDTGVKPSQQT